MQIEHHLEIEHNFQNIFCEKSFRECLSEEDFQKYLDGKKTITISKGKLVFKEGEIPKGVFYIEKGAVKLYKMGFNRKSCVVQKKATSSATALSFPQNSLVLLQRL